MDGTKTNGWSDRVAKPRSEEEASSQLFVASSILVQLMESVGVFVDWWSELHTKLSYVSEKAKAIQPGRIVKLSVRSSASEWKTLKQMYLHYNSIVSYSPPFSNWTHGGLDPKVTRLFPEPFHKTVAESNTGRGSDGV